jgi:putative aminopeptidase FrvX
MEKLESLLKKLSEAAGVSAQEQNAKAIVHRELKERNVTVREDRVGNLIAYKRGRKGNGKVMLAAHIDEIGFMVTLIDEGYLRFSTIGGFDPRILPGKRVLVHGKKPLPGIIGSIPPHFIPKEKRTESPSVEDLFIDVGLSERGLKSNVEVGDFVSVRKSPFSLLNERLCGKSLDNRTSVSMLITLFDELEFLAHDWDVYGVFTVQEEITGLGGLSSAYHIKPDVAIAIDVGFSRQSGFPQEYPVELDKGPSIAIGPNIHSGLCQFMLHIAKEYEIPHQIEAEPGVTGTDAAFIQIAREGIPTVLLSIPLSYMHTPSEIVSLRDIKRTTRLISRFITHLNHDVIKGETNAA